jgi:Zn-dependent protease
MIGKPEWFKRRKYLGWGIQPKTWQGWVYIAVFMIPFIIFNALPIWNTETRLAFVITWILVLVIDVFDIMAKLKHDEREKIHEAIAERNALWGVIIVLIIGVFYDLVLSALQQTVYVNPFIVGALIIALLIKSISNIYLDKKN